MALEWGGSRPLITRGSIADVSAQAELRRRPLLRVEQCNDGTRLSSLASGELRFWLLAPSSALGSSTCGAVRAMESRCAQQLSLCRSQLTAQHG